MSFKAKIATSVILTTKNGNFRQYVSPDKYEFTINRIHLPSTKVIFLDPKYEIFNKGEYELLPLETDDPCYSEDSQFQVRFDNGIVANLVTTPFNTFLIKWTHKISCFHKNKPTIVQTVQWIITTAIAAYAAYLQFLSLPRLESQLKDKEDTQKFEKLTMKDSLNIYHSIFSDTTGRFFGTFHKPYKNDTTDNNKK